MGIFEGAAKLARFLLGSTELMGATLRVRHNGTVTVDGDLVGRLRKDGRLSLDDSEEMYAAPGDRVMIELRVLEGVLDHLYVSGDVAAESTVQISEVDGRGNVNCGPVNGDVHADGNVNCGPVGMDVEAGGNVTAGPVAGDVEAEGNVTVNGPLTGDVSAEGSVTITGPVNGDVECEGDVSIQGLVAGSIHAEGDVNISQVGAHKTL